MTNSLRRFISVAVVGCWGCWMYGLCNGQTTAPAPSPTTDASAPSHASITINWAKVNGVSRSTATLQVVVNPLLEKGSSIHDGTFAALRSLGADDVRYVPWLPYPRLGVAELKPPTPSGTSWDFSRIDPITLDFLNATLGHDTVMNFSTIPQWMFTTAKPVTFPDDPDKVFWHYTQGKELREPSGKELGDYYARLVSWYTKGGFTDERGQFHNSGYHYKFPIWEVLNEVEFEHGMTPQQYTERYDAIVAAIHKVSPDTKFMGMALAQPLREPQWFEYFLNHANHKPGIPIDYISYHFYASPSDDQDLDDWQYTFFGQADEFLTAVRFIENIRQRLSPQTKTDTDELGVILPNDNADPAGTQPVEGRIPHLYWNAAGSLYAYLFLRLSRDFGVEIIGESQLVGYPSQFPSVSMMDWTNAKPNARYWVLKVIKDHFGPGDQLVGTRVSGSHAIEAQGYLTKEGKELLLFNKRNRAAEITLPATTEPYELAVVDSDSGDDPPRATRSADRRIKLNPFAVAVVSWK
jgi:hypothetical protein